MGQSTDAILIYGVHVPDSDDMHYEELPWAKAPLSDEDFEGDSSWGETLVRRANARGENVPDTYEARHALEEEYHIEPVRHCSCEYPMWILGIKATHKEASRGGPVDLGGSLPVIPNAGIRELKAWCDEFDIEFAPGWILCSDWC